MEVEITKKQYQKLLELLYIGEFIAKGDRAEPLKEYEGLLQYIYSLSNKFQCDDLIEYDSSNDNYFPIFDFEEKMQEMIEEYTENDFWENLILKLSKRDATREHGKNKLESMELKDKMKAIMKYENKYFHEIEENGLRNFEVKFNFKDKTPEDLS